MLAWRARWILAGGLTCAGLFAAASCAVGSGVGFDDIGANDDDAANGGSAGAVASGGSGGDEAVSSGSGLGGVGGELSIGGAGGMSGVGSASGGSGGAVLGTGGGGGCVIVDVMPDGNFELDPTLWKVFSEQGVTPLVCTVTSCPPPAGIAGPNDGAGWAWLGHFTDPTDPAESNRIEQKVIIPTSATLLEFQISAPRCAVSEPGKLAMRIDTTPLFSLDVANFPTCNQDLYVQQQVDVSNFADGQPHLVVFDTKSAVTAGNTDFFIDQVRLLACQ